MIPPTSPLFPVPQKRTVPSVARSVAAVTNESTLAAIVRTAEEESPSVSKKYVQVEALIVDLVNTSLKTHDWSVLEKLSSGKFDYLDSQMAPVAAKKASVMPLPEAERFRTVTEVPNWVAALAKILLSTKAVCPNYASEGKNIPINDGFMRKLRAVEPSVSLKRAVSVKLMLEAESLLEKEVTWFMPEVTETPAFFLLLTTYEALHRASLSPSFSHGTDDSTTYFDLVQTLLQRFSGKCHAEELEKYLSAFRFRNADGNYLSELMSRIDYEGFMERMVERGDVRKKVTDALMNRIDPKNVTETQEK